MHFLVGGFWLLTVLIKKTWRINLFEFEEILTLDTFFRRMENIDFYSIGRASSCPLRVMILTNLGRKVYMMSRFLSNYVSWVLEYWWIMKNIYQRLIVICVSIFCLLDFALFICSFLTILMLLFVEKIAPLSVSQRKAMLKLGEAKAEHLTKRVTFSIWWVSKKRKIAEESWVIHTTYSFVMKPTHHHLNKKNNVDLGKISIDLEKGSYIESQLTLFLLFVYFSIGVFQIFYY